MSQPFDPRVFKANFDMQPELPESQHFAPAPAPFDAKPFEIPAPALPSYGPRVKEPQETLQINRRPVAPAGTSSCNNLRIFLDPESGETPAYLISAGQIGDEIIAEQSVSGSQIFAKITLTPSDGTYTATIESSCTASDTVTCVLLGSIADDVITQHTCGPIWVETCRNWFESPAKYSLSVS